MQNSLTKQTSNLKQANEQLGYDNPIIAQQASKALAEVQGKIYMAKQFPRDIKLVQDRIEASCERKSLAEQAEYEYTKGGTTIVGASIKLLETIAQCYQNIHYTWKEISRDTISHKSVCIAEAWDLENNVSSTLEFEVSHYRDVKQTRVLVTSERDLYELIASNASRRVRKCLESVVPRDLVDLARDKCAETLTQKVDIQKGIDDGLYVFKEKYGISLKQVEAYFGLSRQGFNKNHYIKLQKLFTSFKDGVASPDDVFPKEEVEKTTTSRLAKSENVDNNQTEAFVGEI
jgi:hypothetical protein